MNSSRRAFTLTEILVVIAVVGLLAAILFPVLNRVRANSRASTCSSNLRQIGQALSLYTSDYDGFHPPVATFKLSEGKSKFNGVWWMNLNLSPMPVCPDVDPNWMSSYPRVKPWISGYASNYNLNDKTGSWDKPNLSGKAEVVLRYPSLTVAAFDARPLLHGMRQPDTMQTVGEMKGVVNAKQFVTRILQLPPGATRHQDGANYLFGDGHVKWMKPEQLSTTRQNDGVHPGFGL